MKNHPGDILDDAPPLASAGASADDAAGIARCLSARFDFLRLENAERTDFDRFLRLIEILWVGREGMVTAMGGFWSYACRMLWEGFD